MNALVHFRDVTKRFGDDFAIRDANLEIERGKITALIGPSGCGKSTILRLIVGLVTADTGEIQFDGEKIAAETIMKIRRRLGYVIQDGGLFPHLTARHNLTLQPRLFRKRRDEIEKRIMELCELTKFPGSGLDRYPLELSGGQRQRVSLMRALMLSPELLLLDEPFAALDPLVRMNLQRDLKEICARLQQTVLLVTHDLAEAAFLGNEIALMSEGQIIQRGSIADLRAKPANEFVREFVSAQRGLVQL
ncbi:MAG: ABC transporter ATP-binding protein [Verrucomicrobia bacterium]|nr:MAG: ABC transporter ATP-binding protein [Verrucomicrobiota bacterium]TMP93814.1 MAG: ATP-binding cassette domain-containing protein [Verrucomicrobiota bacterium]